MAQSLKYTNTIIVSVYEGRYFTKDPKNKIYIQCRFNNEILTTDPVDSQLKPVWDTELAWHIDSKTLRYLKSQRVMLKLQCYTLNMDKGVRDLIGYLMLDLRQLQRMPVKEKWLPLLNTNTNGYRPELKIAFGLEGAEAYEEPKPAQRSPIKSEKKAEVKKTAPSNRNSPLPIFKPVDFEKLEDMTYRIGSGNEKFRLNIIFDESSQFESIFVHQLDLDSDYCLKYEFLYDSLQTEKFNHLLPFQQHKAEFKFNSSLPELTKFFCNKELIIYLCCKNTPIAFCRIDLNELSQQLPLVPSPWNIHRKFIFYDLKNEKEEIPECYLFLSLILQKETSPAAFPVKISMIQKPILSQTKSEEKNGNRLLFSLESLNTDNEPILPAESLEKINSSQYGSTKQINVESKMQSDSYPKLFKESIPAFQLSQSFNQQPGPSNMGSFKSLKSSHYSINHSFLEDKGQPVDQTIIQDEVPAPKPVAYPSIPNSFRSLKEKNPPPISEIRQPEFNKVTAELEIWKREQIKMLREKEENLLSELRKDLADKLSVQQKQIQTKMEEIDKYENKTRELLKELEQKEKHLTQLTLDLEQQKKTLNLEYQKKLNEYENNTGQYQKQMEKKLQSQKEKLDDLEKQKNITIEQKSQLQFQSDELEHKTNALQQEEPLFEREKQKLEMEYQRLLKEKEKMLQSASSIEKTKTFYKQAWKKALFELEQLKRKQEEEKEEIIHRDIEKAKHLEMRYLAKEEEAICKPSTNNNTKDEVDSAIQEELERLKKERLDLLRTGVYNEKDRLIILIDDKIKELMR